MYFNTNLAFIRKQKKISQVDLANKIGVDQSTISLWEKGMDTTIDNAIKVAEALDVPIPDFLGRDLRFEDNTQKKTFERDGMKITIGKDGDITNDDFDDAMAFLLEQKIINKKDKENDNKH